MDDNSLRMQCENIDNIICCFIAILALYIQ